MLMPTDLVILLAALIISWLVFIALIKVVKTTISTAIRLRDSFASRHRRNCACTPASIWD